MNPPNLSLLFIMVCFWLTTWLAYRYLIVPVGRVLAERRRGIDDAGSEWENTNNDYLAATERLEGELAEAAREAARLRDDLRQEALKTRQTRLEAARRSADEKLQGALGELVADADSARGELRDRAAELARLFAAQLLEREVRS